MSTATIKKPKTDKTRKTVKQMRPSDPADGMEAPPIEDTSDPTTFDLPQDIIPKKGATLETCKTALQTIEAQFSILDTRMGWVGWLKGKTLAQAKSACLTEQKKFEDFCREIGIKRSTAFLYIRIANHYKSARQVKGKTLTQLRDGSKTRSNSTSPRVKTTATVRTSKQSIARIPNDLDAVLKVLTAALGMDLGTNLDEIKDPAKVYGDCVKTLRHIEERARECVTEYEQRIDDIKQTDKQAEEKGLTLESREAVLDYAA